MSTRHRKTVSTFVLILALASRSACQDLPPSSSQARIRASVAARLVISFCGDHNSELNFFHDDSVSGEGFAQFSRMLSEAEVPMTSYSASDLAERKKDFPKRCPAFVPWSGMEEEPENFMVPEDVFYRQPQLVPVWGQPRAVVVWVNKENLRSLLDIFESAILWCKQYINLGVFDSRSKFLFFVEDMEANRILFDSDAIQNHPHVASVTFLDSDRIAVWNYNFYHINNGLPDISLKRLHNMTDTGTTMISNDFFANQDSFGGMEMKVVNIPYAHYSQANSNPDGGTLQLYKDHWGFIPSIVETLQEKLDFRVTYYNPDPPWAYGDVVDDGTWDGVIGLLHNRTCHMTTDLSLYFKMLQVTEVKPHIFQDYEAFASPNPKQKDKLDAILSPFDRWTWIATLTTIVTLSVLLYVFEDILQTGVETLEALSDKFWLVFSVVVGEPLFRKYQEETMKTIGILLGTWVMTCFCLSVAYSSSLMSYLTRPAMTESVDTLTGITTSGLPWTMALYDTEKEDILAAIEEPPYKQIWAEKISTYVYETDLDDVYNGTGIRIDWLASLITRIRTQYTSSNGKAMIHLASEALHFKRFSSAVFRPGQPWIGRMMGMLARISDSGLTWIWQERAWRRMRAQLESRLTPEDTCTNCPLLLEHYYGTLLVLGFMVALSLISFLGEALMHRRKTSAARKRPSSPSAKNGKWVEVRGFPYQFPSY